MSDEKQNPGWITDRLPENGRVVLIALAQPEELTGSDDQPTPVWVGYWKGVVWRTVEADEVGVLAWMDFPAPPTTQEAA